MKRWVDEQMDGKMDGQKEIHICVLQDIKLFGTAAKKEDETEVA